MFRIKSGPQHLHGRRAYIHPQWESTLAELGITTNCDWMGLQIGQLFNISQRVKVYKVPIDDNTNVYFKTYSFHGRLKDYFMRSSKCAVEVKSYQTLKQIGIPTVQPLAFGEDRVCGLLRSCFVITLGVEDAKDLEKFAWQDWVAMAPVDKQQAYEDIFAETAKLTRTAHEAGFFHHDLKWRNIMIKKENKRYKTVWIDCPRGKMAWRSERGRMVDLSCLARLALQYMTRTQRLRFLYAYYGQKAVKKEVHRMWRLVSAHLARRLPLQVSLDQQTS